MYFYAMKTFTIMCYYLLGFKFQQVISVVGWIYPGLGNGKQNSGLYGMAINNV